MESPTRLFDELTGYRVAGGDRAMRDLAVRMANRYSRRSFLGRVSRVGFAALGGSFLTVLLPQESAFANHCFSGPPDSCLCRNLGNPGANRCRSGDCAGGNWLTCCNGTNCNECNAAPGGARSYRRYQDCCSPCAQGCRSGPGGCAICCNSEPNPNVYCNNCHGDCGGGNTTVYCVVTSCTSIAC